MSSPAILSSREKATSTPALLSSYVAANGWHLPKILKLIIDVLDRLINLLVLFPVGFLLIIIGNSWSILVAAYSVLRNIFQIEAVMKESLKLLGWVIGTIVGPYLHSPELLFYAIHLLAALGARGLFRYIEVELQKIIDNAFDIFVTQVSDTKQSRWSACLNLMQSILLMTALSPIALVFAVANFALNVVAILLNIVRDMVLLKFSALWRNLGFILVNVMNITREIFEALFLKMLIPVLGLPFEIFTVVFKFQGLVTKNAQNRHSGIPGPYVAVPLQTTVQKMIDDSFDRFVEQAHDTTHSRSRACLNLIKAVALMTALSPVTLVFSVATFALNVIAILLQTIQDVVLLRFSAVWRNVGFLLENILDITHRVFDALFIKMLMPVLGLPFELVTVILNFKGLDHTQLWNKDLQFPISDSPRNYLAGTSFSRWSAASKFC